MKSNLYLKHDLYAMNDIKLRKLVNAFGPEGYAVFFEAACSLTKEPSHKIGVIDLSADLAYALRMDARRVSEILHYAIKCCDLLVEEDDLVYSIRVTESCSKVENYKAQQAEHAKKGWTQRQPIENQSNDEAIQRLPIGNPKATQRLGNANNKDKEEDKDIKKEIPLTGDIERKEKNSLSSASLLNEFISLCPLFPAPKFMTDSRKRGEATLLKTFTVEKIREAFTKANASEFLQGKNDRGWKATFDWILKPDSITRILEGKYDSRNPQDSSRTPGPKRFQSANPIDDIHVGEF